jgi:uncharacterized protein YndB with AHSA1/START domain
MTVIRLQQTLPAPPAVVYDYVIRPARWKEWHPSSLRADAHALESLPAGARFEEDVRSAGFRRHLRWTVEQAEPGQRWAARAEMDDGSHLRLLYELAPEGTGTRFTRTLDYRLRPWWLRLANDLLMWRRVRAESRHALERLAARLAG